MEREKGNRSPFFATVEELIKENQMIWKSLSAKNVQIEKSIQIAKMQRCTVPTSSLSECQCSRKSKKPIWVRNSMYTEILGGRYGGANFEVLVPPVPQFCS